MENMFENHIGKNNNDIKFNLFYDNKGKTLQQIMETCATHFIPHRAILDAEKTMMYNSTDE